MKNDIKTLLKEKIIILDGAMGTMLFQSGVEIGLCPEVLNITHPKLITEIHKSYINSGADIIYTNTFGANSKKIPQDYTLKEIISSAIDNAKNAAAENTLIAYDMGPSGQLLEPMGKFKFDQAYELFKEQAVLAERNGCDLIVCETMTDLYELKAAVLAVKENTGLPVFCTMSFDENMRTFQGTDISCMALTLEGLGIDAIGINCSLGPVQILPIAKELLKWTDLPVIVKANAGFPSSDGATYDVNASEFKEINKELIKIGVSIIGGCCGTTPEYITGLKEISKDKKPLSRKSVDFTAVCSSVKTVKIEGVKVVGERLNPTGKKPYREALIKGDYDFIIQQGLSQAEAGADILDVNTGLPEINEAEVMTSAVKALQSILDIPLQIDSSNPLAIERALRYYNGKAIVNSVNGDDQTLDAILPLVKKYGACVIGLTLDKKGLPDSWQKRIEIAEKIIAKASEYGIKKSDIIIDPLALTVSTEQNQVLQTLTALTKLKEMGIKTLLGISNISFGLPSRENINLAFMTMALSNGLNLPIINPEAVSMMNAVKSFKVLSGEDVNAENYVNAFNTKDSVKEIKKDNFDIKYCILKGLKTECAEACKILLKSIDALTVVNDYIIPALDKVGELFEKGTFFLPQLIQSAETAKSAFDEIKKIMPKGSNKSGKKIVLATVKGDIHDIGKNIVKVVLENYGYEIIDLGRNVEAEVIVNTAISENALLIGLSALMTTTVSNMENTIKAIKKSGHTCKIMVGGAVLTEDYAKKIGADYYAKDANNAVKIAKLTL